MKTSQDCLHLGAQQTPYRTSLLQTNITSIHRLQNTREAGSTEHSTTHPTFPHTTRLQTQPFHKHSSHTHCADNIRRT